MATLQIYQQVLDIFPDCNRRFAGALVSEALQHRYDAIVVKKKQIIGLPPVPTLPPDALDDEEFDFEKENQCTIQNYPKDFLNEKTVFETTQLILERLLTVPSYPKKVQKRAASALDTRVCDQRKSQSPLKRKISPVEGDDLLMEAAAAPRGRPSTSLGISARSSVDISSPSPSEDDPSYLPQLYEDESIQLLTNEFRWLFVNAIKAAFKLNNRMYLDTRKFLIGLVEPDLEDVNVAAIDPVHPQYPRRIDTLLAKTKERTHLIKDGNKYELLKVARKASAAPINVTHPRLATELAKMRTSTETKPIHCLCCDDETTVDTLVTCSEGHIYCQPCLIDYVKAKIQDGVKQGYLECMQHECSAPFSQAVLISRIPNDLMEQLDERVAMANLNQANIPDLVRCPKCNTVFELDASLNVLDCIVCKHSSCRHCHQPWNDEHRGKRCEELESNNETKMRQLYEERMTAELIRPCPKCRTPLMKVEGCNKLTCSCQATLCYVCREPFIGYDHFCQHPRNPGQPCDQCQKCSLWIDPAAEDAARIKRIDEEAKAVLERERVARLNQNAVFPKTKQTTSDVVEIVQKSLASLTVRAPVVAPAPAPAHAPAPAPAPAPAHAPAPAPAHAPIPFNNLLNRFHANVAVPVQNIFDQIARPFGLPPMLDEFEQLLLAANRNDVATIERLAQTYGVGILNERSRRERTGEVAMHRVAVLGHLQALRALIRLGANKSLQDSSGDTPLHKAARRNNTAIALELLNNGVDVNEKGDKSSTALYMACWAGRFEVARLLIDRGANLEARETQYGNTPLLGACYNGSVNVVELLLSKNIAINGKDNRGNTPLHLASSRGHVAIVHLLVQRGAPVNQLNNCRRNALHLAAFRGPGNLTTVRALIEAGINVNARDVGGHTPADNARYAAKPVIEREIRTAQIRIGNSNGLRF